MSEQTLRYFGLTIWIHFQCTTLIKQSDLSLCALGWCVTMNQDNVSLPENQTLDEFNFRLGYCHYYVIVKCNV